MLRKIFRTGNSLVVSLPKEMLTPLGLTDGANVSVELDHYKGEIIIRRADVQSSYGVDEEFARQVSEFIEEYRPALESLSKK